MSTLKFLGAAGTVTGSSFWLDEILIDLGMFQGGNDLEKLNHVAPQLDVSVLKGVILTHAHLDHCGRLPWLIKMGYKGPIYMTAATGDLMEIALLDMAKINREGDHEVQELLKLIHIVDYRQRFTIGDYTCELCDAGHILGSASVLVEKNDQKIIFSGDLGNSPEDLLSPTQTFPEADTVIMESTYGDRTHADEDPLQVLAEEINAVETDSSTLLIPAFAIERSQELLHNIDHLKKTNKIKADTLVFLDSPMAKKATEVYRKYKNLYSPELAEHVKIDDPFNFPGLVVVESAGESNNIMKFKGAKVIIAGSGMMTGGRVLNHARKVLIDSKNRLLIVGYQAMGTMGRKILDGEIKIEASLRKSSGMSAHADSPKLLAWLSSIVGVKKVFLIHGEDSVRKIMASKISNQVLLPNLNFIETI